MQTSTSLTFFTGMFVALGGALAEELMICCRHVRTELYIYIDRSVDILWERFFTGRVTLFYRQGDIRKLMRSKRRLHTKFKKTQCPKVLDKYKEMRHTLQREIRKSYWAYIEDIIDYTADINNDRQTKTKTILVIH